MDYSKNKGMAQRLFRLVAQIGFPLYNTCSGSVLHLSGMETSHFYFLCLAMFFLENVTKKRVSKSFKTTIGLVPKYVSRSPLPTKKNNLRHFFISCTKMGSLGHLKECKSETLHTPTKQKDQLPSTHILSLHCDISTSLCSCQFLHGANPLLVQGAQVW